MQVLVNIMLGPLDNLTMTPDEVASVILEAIGGNPTDTVRTSIQQMPDSGLAGLDVHAEAAARAQELQDELAAQPPLGT